MLIKSLVEKPARNLKRIYNHIYKFKTGHDVMIIKRYRSDALPIELLSPTENDVLIQPI